MKNLLKRIWLIFSGRLQWRILWIAHSKYNVGFSAIVTNEKDEVLLARHRFRRHEEWSLPSGWMSAGESIEETVKRELLEETGLEVENVRLHQFNSGFKLRVEVITTASVIGKQSIKVDDFEVQEAQFFPLNCLPDDTKDSHSELLIAQSKTEGPNKYGAPLFP